MNTRFITPLIFLIFLVSGYSVMGYMRHYLYDETIQEHVTNWTTTLEEGIEKPMGWETHEYLGTPEAVLVISDPVFVN